MNDTLRAVHDYDIKGDPDRLSALRFAALSEFAAGAAFDRLSRLAASLLSAPIAMIGFVDEAQLVLTSKFGFSPEWDNIREVPFAGSLCGRVLKSERQLVLDDVRTSDQYRNREAVKGLGAVAFAGLPLVTSDSHLIGVVCVIDNSRREWNRVHLSSLNDLGQSILSELELRAARHLYSKYARDLADQHEHNLILRERQYRTEERLLHIGFDETARERAENARKQIENILEGITDGFFALDKSMRFTFINDRAEKLLHRTRGELIDTLLTDHPTPSYFIQRLKQVQMFKSPQEFEYNDESDGSFFEVLAYPSPTGISVYFHDVTERKKAAEEIELRSIELQALSHRLVEVQEQERGQIARELHDEVGQILTGLKLTLSAARRLPDSARDKQLDLAQQLVNELIGHVRDLSLDLRPAMLDDLGLLPALLWHFDRYTTQTSIEVTFSQADIDRRFDQAVETAAYRIVQEALTNVARYSKVGEACVRVHNVGDALHIEVEDAGIGFDADKAIKAGASNGITGMRERVRLLRGVFRIDSTPGEGAVVRASIPFPSDYVCESQTSSINL